MNKIIKTEYRYYKQNYKGVKSLNRSNLKQLSKDQLKGHWKVPVLITFAYSVLTIGITIMQNHSYSGFEILMAFLISLALQVWIFVGIPNLYLEFIERKGEVTFKDVLVSKGVLLKALGCVVIIGIIGTLVGVVIGMAIVSSMVGMMFGYLSISITSCCLIIFSIIVSILLVIFDLAISMVPYILIDKNDKGLFEAMGLSIKMMKGYKWKLFVIHLSFIGWGILSILTLGIGYLWLAPYVALTLTNFYKELDKAYVNK